LLIHHEIATNVGGTPIFDPLSDGSSPRTIAKRLQQIDRFH